MLTRLAFAIFIPPLVGFGQSMEWPSITMEGGLCRPMGDYAARGSENAGYALSSYSLGAELEEDLDWGFAVDLAFRWHDNSLDIGALREASLQPTLQSDPYRNFWLLGGVTYRVSIQSEQQVNLSFSPRLGALFSRYPQFSIWIDGLGNFPSFAASKTSLAYGLKAAVEWGRLQVFSEYLHSSPVYDFIVAYNETTHTTLQTEPIKQPTTVLLIGLGYRIF
jgi:hypothetical protein